MKTTRILILIFITALLFFSLGYMGPKGSPDSSIEPGTYNALVVKKAFNPYSGEPEYWIIAETIKEKMLAAGVDKTVELHQGDYKFYQVPRTEITNLPDDNNADPDFSFSGKIIVK